jgi:hypothetical protein
MIPCVLGWVLSSFLERFTDLPVVAEGVEDRPMRQACSVRMGQTRVAPASGVIEYLNLFRHLMRTFLPST